MNKTTNRKSLRKRKISPNFKLVPEKTQEEKNELRYKRWQRKNSRGRR